MGLPWLTENNFVKNTKFSVVDDHKRDLSPRTPPCSSVLMRTIQLSMAATAWVI